MITIKKLTELKPNRIYFLSVPIEYTEPERTQLRDQLKDLREDFNIIIVIISENLKLINAPKGYMITKNE